MCSRPTIGLLILRPRDAALRERRGEVGQKHQPGRQRLRTIGTENHRGVDASSGGWDRTLTCDFIANVLKVEEALARFVEEFSPLVGVWLRIFLRSVYVRCDVAML
jgi:hypothetical protein